MGLTDDMAGKEEEDGEEKWDERVRGWRGERKRRGEGEYRVCVWGGGGGGVTEEKFRSGRKEGTEKKSDTEIIGERRGIN